MDFILLQFLVFLSEIRQTASVGMGIQKSCGYAKRPRSRRKIL